MLRIPISANYRTPGFDWREHHDGSIRGRLYTTWPLRFRTRFRVMKWVAAAIAIFVCLETRGDIGLKLSLAVQAGVAAFVYIYPLTLIWPFFPFGKSVKIDTDHLSIGWRRFDLRETSTFRTMDADNHRSRDAKFIFFRYGTKDITINVRFPPDHALLIAEALNEARANFIEHGALYADEHAEAQSARVSAF